MTMDLMNVLKLKHLNISFNNVKLNDIFKTIKRIKTIMINNSHLIRLCHNYETK